jgi:hypothetical protein
MEIQLYSTGSSEPFQQTGISVIRKDVNDDDIPSIHADLGAEHEEIVWRLRM